MGEKLTGEEKTIAVNLLKGITTREQEEEVEGGGKGKRRVEE